DASQDGRSCGSPSPDGRSGRGEAGARGGAPANSGRGCTPAGTADRPRANAADRAARARSTTMTTPTTGRDREEWIDRTTAATLAGCAVDTIRRDQRDHTLTVRTGPNGSTLLRLGDLIDIGRVPATVLDPVTTARQVAEAAGLRRELTDLQVAHAELR